MTYVSYLSARGLLRNVAIILIAGLILFGFTIHNASHGDRIPWEQIKGDHLMMGLVAAAGFIALIIATIRSSSLDALSRVPAITFTRPVSRTVIALQTFAVDAATVGIVWLATLLVLILQISAIGGFSSLDASVGVLEVVAIFAAPIVMWYGLVVLVSTLMPGRGGAIVGISWAVFIVLPGIAQLGFPQPISGILRALLVFDPIQYVTGFHGSISFGEHSSNEALALHLGLRSAVAAIIGILALAAAVQVWIRKDAVA